MSIDALIGHSGFVGGTLSRQHAFAARFNTSNIDAIVGREFDTLVCAAAPGSMFTANREPERDREQIEALIERLDGVNARRFVLISSIAVLADFAAGDDESTQAFQKDLPYGRHRRVLEAFCETRFENFLVVRLPALFGSGLRKNFIFDLLNPVPTMLPRARLEMLLGQLPPALRDVLVQLYVPDMTGMYAVNREALNSSSFRPELEAAVRAAGMSATQFHNPGTSYQYYDLSRLWCDIGIATKFALRHLHLATEPLLACDIHSRLLGSEMPSSDARLHREEMHTRHAALWGREGHYLEDADTLLNSLAAFFLAHRRGA